MRKFFVAASIFLLWLAGAGPGAQAQGVPGCPKGGTTVPFAATGALQTYDVPVGASTVLIDAFGAAGGDKTADPYLGGLGAHVVAEVPVTGGATLNVVVGQQGVANEGTAAGGGGASAVSTSGGTPLVVAGGGGGAGETQDGYDAELGEAGGSSDGGGGATGGTSGNGGMAAAFQGYVGGGGGGWLTAGGTNPTGGSGEGGHALSGDAAGGAAGTDGVAGGYGGGGGSAGPSAGGGGGYGGGGTGIGPNEDGAGGGGSFAAAGAVQSYFEVASFSGNGQVTICVGPSSVPVAPASALLLFALGLLALGALSLRRTARARS